MPELNQKNTINKPIDTLAEALESGRFLRMRRLLASLHPAETAHLLESLPPEERKVCWPIINPDLRGDVLSYVGEDVQADLIQHMDTADLVSATEDLAPDDVADILQNLPDHVTQEILNVMDSQHRRRVETILAYEEDTAGGLMNTDVVTVRSDITLEVVLRYLRLLGELPENTDSLYVVDHQDHYLGTLPLSQVVSRSRSLTVSNVMSHQVEAIHANVDESDVALRFEKHDLISAPVVDKDNRLLGRITIDDVVDVIRDDAEHTMLSMAGLGEDEDTFAPIGKSIHRRSLWLGVNLLTAFLAAWVIGLFEATIAEIVALAVLMPIVASMGGIAGSQTLTLVIRGLALHQISSSNSMKFLAKEIAIGAVNGIVWSIVVASLAALWFSSTGLGLMLGGAMIINLCCASLAGVLIPLFLQKKGIDPALAGGVLLTTVTDVIGFMSFLGLATIFLTN
mgnify:CR=1 FL=1